MGWINVSPVISSYRQYAEPKLYGQPPTRPTCVSIMIEEAIGTMGATLTGKRTWFSGLSNTQCQLVFTTGRIIVARTVGQMSDPLGRATYRIGTNPQELKGLDLETILRADQRNFSINYPEIEKIELGMKWRNVRAHVYTKNGTHRFMWTWPVKLNNVEDSLRSLLPRAILFQRVDKLD